MLYVGTYTSGESKGIYRLHLDLATGALDARGRADGDGEPVLPGLPPRAAVPVRGQRDRRRRATTRAAASAPSPSIPQTGALTLPQPAALRRRRALPPVRGQGRPPRSWWPTTGAAASPCCRSADGRLGRASAVVQHQGRRARPRGRTAPHAHSVNLDPANRFAFVADLGLDKVLVYRFDAATGRSTPTIRPPRGSAPGAGPRHFAFHPDGPPRLRHQRAATPPSPPSTTTPPRACSPSAQTLHHAARGLQGRRTTTAEVVVHPDGKFVYGSNRGHDSIAIFAVDPAHRRS